MFYHFATFCLNFLQDKAEYVTERLKTLINAGMLTCLSALAKSESKNTREQVSR